MDAIGEPIDRLGLQLNSVLTQIGRTFRDANRADPKASGRARGQEQRMEVISKANSRFHEALDEIEVEIVQAKSVMERDLNRIRQARRAHEEAQGASKQNELPSSVLSDALAVGAMDLSADAFADPSLLDQISGIDGANPNMDPAAAGFDAAAAAASAGNNDMPKADGMESAAGQGEATAQSQPNANEDGDAADANSAFDFDSIFNDTGGSGGFDLDFGAAASSAPNGTDAAATASANIDDLFGSTSDFADLGASVNSTTGGETQPASNGGDGSDLDALLPGLGSYVNVEGGDLGGDDFAMIDMPTEGLDLGGATGGAGTATAQGQEESQKQDATAATNDSQAAGESSGAAAGEQNTQDTTGVEMDDVNDIFGDMMDVGNMDGANLDDFDWGM